MAGMFDDLIPPRQAAKPAPAGLSFDDLIPSKRKVGAGEDALRSFGAGVKKGAAGIGDTLLQASPMGQVSNFLTSAASMADVFRGRFPTPQAPMAPLTKNALKDAYQPQTVGGRYAEAVGENVPNALAPGGLVRRAANVILPAVGGQTAVEGARALGAGERGQTAARVVGAVAGGITASANPRALSRPTPKAEKPPAPTLEDLTPLRDQAYQAVADSGHVYEPQQLQGLARDVADDLGRAKLNPARHPRAASMLEDITAIGSSGEPMTLTQLDQLRQVVRRDVASATDDAERFMGKRIIAKIDQFIDAEGGEASPLIRRARDLNTRVRKLESLDNLDEAAIDRAATGGTGSNTENATRQNVRRFAEKTKNLTPAEREAARTVIRGTKPGNALRAVGRLSPEGGTVAAVGSLVAGAATHGIAPAAGFVARRVSDAITQKNLKALRDLIATGDEEAVQQVTAQLAAPQHADLRRQLSQDLVQVNSLATAGRDRTEPRETVRRP